MPTEIGLSQLSQLSQKLSREVEPVGQWPPMSPFRGTWGLSRDLSRMDRVW